MAQMFKIYHTEKKLYSEGGVTPTWGKNGKIWKRKSDVTSHLTQAADDIKHVRDMVHWELVELEVVEKHRAPVLDTYTVKRRSSSASIWSGSKEYLSGVADGALRAAGEYMDMALSEERIIKLSIGGNIKAIADSFFVGFFTEVMRKLQTAERMRETFRLPDEYREQIEKVWEMLEADPSLLADG